MNRNNFEIIRKEINQITRNIALQKKQLRQLHQQKNDFNNHSVYGDENNMIYYEQLINQIKSIEEQIQTYERSIDVWHQKRLQLELEQTQTIFNFLTANLSNGATRWIETINQRIRFMNIQTVNYGLNAELYRQLGFIFTISFSDTEHFISSKYKKYATVRNDLWRGKYYELKWECFLKLILFFSEHLKSTTSYQNQSEETWMEEIKDKFLKNELNNSISNIICYESKGFFGTRIEISFRDSKTHENPFQHGEDVRLRETDNHIFKFIHEISKDEIRFGLNESLSNVPEAFKKLSEYNGD